MMAHVESIVLQVVAVVILVDAAILLTLVILVGVRDYHRGDL